MKTFQVTYQPTRLYASEDVAQWLGVRHADLMRSFEAMYQTWPEVGDCGVTDTTAKNLAFYRACGFVPFDRIPDFFTRNYPQPIVEEGILLRDMVYLRRRLSAGG